jgi:flavin-dependent dehydrogenase
LRIGNAAGEAHPLIGEGMTMALQSAWLLSHGLQQARLKPVGSAHAWQTPVAGEYAAQWASHFRPRLRTAALFAHLAMHRVSAPALMGLLQAHPALLTRAARWSGKADGFTPLQTLAPAAPTPTRPNPTRSNDDGRHPGHTAADTDQGLPTGA